MAEHVLEVRNLIKDYGKFRAVNGISFSIPRGQVIGFLGPNGAGKTTTIQILLGITTPTSGAIQYFGKDFIEHRVESLQRINFTSAFNTLLGRISAYQNLVVFAQLYQVPDATKKINDLLSYFEVTQFKDLRYNDLSAGQKTRINLIKSLINDPEIVLMDEPTASLDPDIADKTLTLIEELRRDKNLTILFTSHNMDEVTRICDDVIILDKGTIVAHDTPVGLTKLIPNAEVRLTFDSHRDQVEKYLKEKQYSYTFENDHMAIIETEEKLIPKLIFGISKTDIWITDIEVNKPDLEDVFLQIARKS
ncbi:ABC transporter ATP-binding protein [Candidatus Roizmanbacteria bacterium]|nr:ABC transporter ATP-binding protein [Candidatus Roizmanbacteria bacterium]